jgi:hypothetical protein
MAKRSTHKHGPQPHIMAAVIIDWDQRTDVRAVVSNPLPNTLLARINDNGFTIDSHPLQGWGRYTHTVRAEDVFITDADGHTKEVTTFDLHAELCPECGQGQS